ncbi:MAG: tRNA pseudouridine(55) synthase TruB [Deltaproteobacteria bacterium]|nr:tRNA pseudouridine(55) synthase TruB [Deltaproteobacteria bacterium]
MARRNQRRRRPEPSGPSGFLVVDKPSGQTSHDVVDSARRWLGTRRVGHLGTLDPQATGVLPLAVRAATKLIPFIEDAWKAYDGTIVLGVATDTLDREGEVRRRFDGPLPEQAEVEEALREFLGDIQQVPPMYSAVKKDGVPLHRLARQGQEVERDPKWVTIEEIEIVRHEPPELDVRVLCSAGTYVRVLAADLGEELGCGAHLGGLRRTRSGPFDLGGAHAADECAAAAESGKIEALLVPPTEALGFPVHSVDGEQQIRLQNGGDLPSGDLHRVAPGTRVSVVSAQGEFLAVAEIRADRRLWPLRVLPPEPL